MGAEEAERTLYVENEIELLYDTALRTEIVYMVLLSYAYLRLKKTGAKRVRRGCSP
jgi:hypothetical protein